MTKGVFMFLASFILVYLEMVRAQTAEDGEKWQPIDFDPQKPLRVLFNDGDEQVVIPMQVTNDLIQWRKGDQIIDESEKIKFGENHELIILSPEEKDEGTYYYKYTNEFGIATSQMIILKRSYITLKDISAKHLSPTLGKPLKLECQIPDGYPKPVVQWFYKSNADTEAVPVLDRRITQGADGNLYFTSVQKEHLSDSIKGFICKVANKESYRPDKSNPDMVITDVSFDELIDNNDRSDDLDEVYLSEDVKVLAGEKAEIYCIYGSYNILYPTWLKDGTEVKSQPGDRVTIYNRSSGKRIIVQNARPEDSGTYTCVLDNGQGLKKTHDVKLTVEAVPRFTNSPPIVTAKIGSTAIISCAVDGVPQPTVEFSFSVEPSTGVNVNLDKRTITIDNVNEDHKGYYRCKATNEHGERYFEIALVVEK